MTGWPDQPVIYEVNTAVWLNEMGRRAGRPITLACVADDEWDAVTPAGIDAVWLMGVWARSPAGLVLAHANADLQQSSAPWLGWFGPVCDRSPWMDDPTEGLDQRS
jgi:hypothetical protein